MSTPHYERQKFMRLVEDFEAKLAGARALGDLARLAQAEALEAERNYRWQYTRRRGEEYLDLQALADLHDDALKDLGLRRDGILQAMELRRRVAGATARYRVASADVQEDGRLIAALKRYVAEGVAQ